MDSNYVYDAEIKLHCNIMDSARRTPCTSFQMSFVTATSPRSLKNTWL